MDVSGEYLKNTVEGASKEDLLLIMLEGGERFIRRAQAELVRGNHEGVHINVMKAQNIYLELFCALDQEAGDFVQHLQGLYYFLYDNLLEANIKKDLVLLGNCLKVAMDLTAMWREVVDKYHREIHGAMEVSREMKSVDIKG